MTRKAYPSDVSNNEWAFVTPYLTLTREDAPQREHSLCGVFYGLRYIVHTTVQWRMMPNDPPPCQVALPWLDGGKAATSSGGLLSWPDPPAKAKVSPTPRDSSRMAATAHSHRSPQVVELCRLQLAPHLLGDHLSAGQHCDVLQHRLPPVTKAGRLDGQGIERAPQLVQHQRRQRFPVHVLSNDHQVLATTLHHLFQNRDDVLRRRDLFYAGRHSQWGVQYECF
jgi:transposase